MFGILIKFMLGLWIIYTNFSKLVILIVFRIQTIVLLILNELILLD